MSELDANDKDTLLGAAPGWPVTSLREATDKLTAAGSQFELEEVTIDGRRQIVWKTQPSTLAALARQVRSAHAGEEFVIFEDERVTYEMWFRATAALAHEMLREGIGKGDRVAIAMRNLPEFPVALFAAASIGAIVVPLNAWWTGSELAYGLQDSGSSLLICDAERWEAIAPHADDCSTLKTTWIARTAGKGSVGGHKSLERLIGDTASWGSLPARDLPDADIDPETDLSIFYTSGTTGKPKGALGTHRNMLCCTRSLGFSASRAALRRGDASPPNARKVTLLTIPLFHVTACNASMMSAITSGSKIVLMRKWDPLTALSLIEAEKVTSVSGVPTIAWQLLEHPDLADFDLSSLEAVSYGGAPSAPELVRRLLAELHVKPGTGWGMTETSATLTTHVAEEYMQRPESCGPALPISKLKIMAPDGRTEMPVGEVGELWAYGAQVAKGYWGKPEESAATFVDGWVRTGDLARLDEDGFCYIVDRVKDIIIRGGENIFSIEIESLLQEHPAVTDVAVVGLPHRTLGEEPAAMIERARGAIASEDDLKAWLRERIAGFKVPVRICIQDQPLPRNANGKILKALVREKLQG